MKNLILITLLTFSITLSYAQMDLPGNGFNPWASISEEVGITSISIEYSRPGVKGRDGKVWGDLVPYGFGSYNFNTLDLSSPWRVGANHATIITFEHDLKVEGKAINAGTYALFMAIYPEKATLILSKQSEAWGSFYYDKKDDVLRVDLTPQKLEESVEWMKFEFLNHTKTGCTIALQWEKLSIPFNIEVDVEAITIARMREEFTGVKGFISANRIHAFMYCLENDINMEEALTWAEKAVTGRPFGQTSFVAYDLLASGYEKFNRTTEADSVMDIGLQIAYVNQFIEYSDKLIANQRADRANEILTRAKKKFGESFDINKAFARLYSSKGEFSKALKYANKSLSQAENDYQKGLVSADIEKLKANESIH